MNPRDEDLCVCGHPRAVHDEDGCFGGGCYCPGFAHEDTLGQETYENIDFKDGVDDEIFSS